MTGRIFVSDAADEVLLHRPTIQSLPRCHLPEKNKNNEHNFL